MWPYVLLILLPLSMQHIRFKRLPIGISSSNKNYISMKIFWGLLFVLLILRHKDVGRDLDTYERIFTMIARSDWLKGLGRSSEVGYNCLNKIISLFTDNFQWVIIVTAILEVYFVAKTYIRYTEDSLLTIVLFVTMSNFVFLFSGLRQSIAISLGMLAFEFVRKKKIIVFIIIVFIAMLFHTSAFMILFMYPLYHVKITKNWLWAIVPILGTVFAFNQKIFGRITLFLSKFTKYEGEIILTGAYTMLILFIIFAIFSYLIPEESGLDADTAGIRNFLLFSIVLQMFAPLHSIAMRMNYYYIIFIPLLIPKIIKCRSVRWNQVAIVARHIMVIFFIIYFFVSAPRDNVLDTFPYKFFWEIRG